MGKFVTDPYLSKFAKTVHREVSKYRSTTANRDEMFEQQKLQLQKLYDLEDEFKNTVMAHKDGDAAMVSFCDYIKNVRRNTLSARPFFKERSTLMADVGPAIKDDDINKLYKYHMNYNLAQYLINHGGLVDKKFIDLYNKMTQVRNEIVICNMPLAINRAKIFFSRTPQSHLEYLDMIQITMTGLFNAIDKYVPPFTHSFKDVIIGRCVGECIANFSIDKKTPILTTNYKTKAIKDFVPGDEVWGVDDSGQKIKTKVVALHDHGELDGFEITFNNGYSITCSENHKFLTPYGMVPIKDIIEYKLGVLSEPKTERGWMDSKMQFKSTDTGSVVCPQKNVREVLRNRISESFGMDFQGQDEIPQTRRLGHELWAQFSNKEKNVCSQYELSDMSAYDSDERSDESETDVGTAYFSKWLAESLWNPFFETSSIMGSSARVLDLPTRSKTRSVRSSRKLATRKSGDIQELNKKGIRSSTGDVEGSGLSRRTQREIKRMWKEMASGESGSSLPEHEEGVVCAKAIEDGILVAVQQHHSRMAGRTNSMWTETQTGGFCESGSQNMDRSGRELSLQGSFNKKSSVTSNTGTRQLIEGGMLAASGCDIDSFGLPMFSTQNGGDKTGMEGMAYEHAPLSETGNLVLRHVVRVRSVGKKRMYDLEVAHPKHNFLLPNGIITSNSQTLLHFFPYDKKKLYNANKIAHKFRDKEIDFEALTAELNSNGILGEKVTVNEITDILMAASHVSSEIPKKMNNSPSVNNSDGQEMMTIDRFADTERKNPEEYLMEANSKKALYSSLNSLSIIEMKIMRLKGALDEDLF